MDIYGSHFEYRGVNSRKYNLVFATVETDRYTSKTANITGVTMFDRKTKRQYLLDNDYSSSPISFDVEITTCDGRPLERFELKEITKWLFAKSRYDKLYFDTFDDTELMLTEHHNDVGDTDSTRRLYINCRFMNPEELHYNDGIVGYKATLESDSPYLWQDEISKTFTLLGTLGYEEFTINVDSDIDDYTYPKVEITKVGMSAYNYTYLFDSNGNIKENVAFEIEDLAIRMVDGEQASVPHPELKNEAGASTIFIPIERPSAMTYYVSIPRAQNDTCPISSILIGVLTCGKEDLINGEKLENASDYIHTTSGAQNYIVKVKASNRSSFLAISYTPRTPSDDRTYIRTDNGLSFYSSTLDFEIKNMSDGGRSGRSTEITNLQIGDTLILDGRTNYIDLIHQDGESELYIESYLDNLITRNFPRLLSGENTIFARGFTGDVLKITWSNRRML